jgi:hypothetical protein
MVTARKAFIGALAAAAACGTALADFITPDSYGWSRGSADSTYFEWDVFTSTQGGNVPDVGQFPDPLPDGWVSPDVVETTGAGFITSSGNIYSPFAPIEIDVTVPNYDYGDGSTTVLLQLRTLGEDWPTGEVNLGGVAPTEVVELDRVFLGDFGWQLDLLFVFEVDGNASEYVVTAPTVVPSVSFDRVAVDTYTEADCVADFNGDGEVNTQDVLAFLNAWTAGDDSADINGDGEVNTQDVLAFLNLWTAGC